MTSVLPWPFFHFITSKLASSVLNLCRRKRSFQWCLDQSDQPNGARDMACTKMRKTMSEKLRAKFLATTNSCFMVKNWLPGWLFLRSFLTASKPSRTSITAAKKEKKRRKRERGKKFKNLKILISAYACAKMT